MLKIALLVLVAISIPFTAFAEPMIELSSAQTEINSLDSVLVVGKATGVSTFKPVKLTVTSPGGVVVYAPDVPLNTNGTFRQLFQPILPSFQTGVYTITATHDEVKTPSQIQFTVINSEPIAKSHETPKINDKTSAISLSTKTEFGSNKIIVTGSTTSFITDITFRVISPNGNLISIAQITPSDDGGFSTEIITSGPLWKENGLYTITATQGLSSEHKQSIQVEINNGVVVPEFGPIAVMILAVAIVSIIAISSKSRLGIIPKY